MEKVAPQWPLRGHARVLQRRPLRPRDPTNPTAPAIFRAFGRDVLGDPDLRTTARAICGAAICGPLDTSADMPTVRSGARAQPAPRFKVAACTYGTS